MRSWIIDRGLKIQENGSPGSGLPQPRWARGVAAAIRIRGWATLCGLLVLSGCATQSANSGLGLQGEQVWKRGEFTVRFVAGPDRIEDEQHKPCSFYQVMRWNGNLPNDIGVSSTMDVWHFQTNPKSRPDDFIKLFVSPSGRTLLIEEDVPNDCAPCWNHVVVRWEDAELKATFLDLPERVTKETEVFGFTPKVSGITDQEISYTYGDGTKVTEPFGRRTKADQRPTPPG